VYFVAVICRGYHGQESADSGAGANLRASPDAHVQQPIPSAHTVSIACTSSNIHPHHQELCSWHHEGDKGKHRIRFRINANIFVPLQFNLLIKSQRLRWAAHVIRMDTTRTVKKLTEWEPCSSRPVGRPRLRWLDQVE